MKNASSASDVGSNSLVKAALGLFLAGYSMMLLFFCLVVSDAAAHREKRITLGKEIGLLYTVGLGAPFVLVRFIYSALGDYTSNVKFSVLYGNNTIYLFMDVLMEIFAVGISLSSGFFVPAPKKPAKEEKKSDETGSEAAEEQASEGTSSTVMEEQKSDETSSKAEEQGLGGEAEATTAQDLEAA
jgi:hypothetical protein